MSVRYQCDRCGAIHHDNGVGTAHAPMPDRWYIRHLPGERVDRGMRQDRPSVKWLLCTTCDVSLLRWMTTKGDG